MKKIIPIFIFVLFLMPSITFADFILIPIQVESIQGGIDLAVNGDTLVVFPGEYSENIDFNGKSIILLGAGLPGTVIINGGGNGSCVNFASGEGTTSALINFTLINGGGVDFGGGINIEQSSPTIILNRITANAAQNGAGISIRQPAGIIPANVYKNVIYENQSEQTGGGIYVSQSPALLISNTIVSNSAAGGGGAVYTDNAVGIFATNNIVSGNTSGDGGALFRNGRISTFTTRYNDVWQNDGGDYHMVDAGEGSISEDPLFIDAEQGIFYLGENSPCIDAGDPNGLPDIDGSQADIGALPYIEQEQPELLTIAPDSVFFGEVPVGSDTTIICTISNPGVRVIRGRLILTEFPPVNFTVSDSVVSLGPGEDLQVSVTFHPAGMGDLKSDLLIINMLDINLSDTLIIPIPTGVSTLNLSGAGFDDNSVSDYQNTPSDADLLSCYPNPFNSILTISYNFEIAGEYTFQVWTFDGKLIETVHRGFSNNGQGSIRWQPQGLTSGVYLISLEHAGGIQYLPVHLLK